MSGQPSFRTSPHRPNRPRPAAAHPARAAALGLLLLAWIAAGPAALAAQAAPAGSQLQPLQIENYREWRTISDESISPDGRWVMWGYRQLLTDDVLHIAELDGARTFTVEGADRARFSDDGRWAAWRLSPSVTEIRRLEADRRPVQRRIELRRLDDGESRIWETATSFEFVAGGRHLLIRKVRGEGWPSARGDDLLLHDLEAGTEELLAAVSDHAFDEEGGRLAFVVETGDREGNGLHLIDLSTGVRRTLDSAPMRYERLRWSDDGSTLAVLRGVTPDGMVQRENALLVFTELDRAEPRRLELDPSGDNGIPEGMVLSEFQALSFNDASDRVFLGVREQEAEPEAAPRGVRRPDVHVFHWNDDRIQTVQQSQAASDRRRTWRAVVHLPTMQFIQLADEEMSGIQITADGRWGVGSDDRAYVSDWEESRSDLYQVDLETGERVLFAEEQGRTLGLSPHSSHFLYWRDGQVRVRDFEAGSDRTLTAGAPVSFVDTGFNRVGTPPPFGVAGWTADGGAVILEHEHDLWLQPLDGGTATNLTGGFGEEQGIRLRVERLDPSERTVDLSRPILLRGFGTRTKASGYFRLDPSGRGGGAGTVVELIWEDRWISSPTRAARADRLLFTRETFREFPDLEVSDLEFRGARRLTEANPQQAGYRWGERILFDFEGPDGVTLQGTLAVPDGWVPGERLPMLVNFYEQNSQNLHRYQVPRHAHRPSFSGYVSRGYLVMQPDIHFRTRTTHDDMLESVEAAVRRVIELGYADPERVGLNGHSFSGGGSAYIAGRSNMFAAVVAGAAPINLRSEFNQLFSGSGQNNHRYDIHGQGRYGTDPYTDLELYIEQSPITHVPTMDTPMIYLHGEDDAVVEYLQGMELYNAARFLRKPLIFLSYPGEGHGLSRLENQLDFQIRIGQFYDHYLKGAPAPDWLTGGVPLLERDQRRVVPDELLVPPS